ncbi:hypothetical protein O6H91_15G010800 [Diphasiastrum complanatum]|uniref:Uncharacterized protein n=1 Tax=Diphasiastrum complanatum TaxID=34168 RepID=A0ACC2BFV0_DIPCM|nr:hypothetical protein O6H91_15G010800 [Diphasiastrum complanatum]
MLPVLRVDLPTDIPVVGCELSPDAGLHFPDLHLPIYAMNESVPIDGHFIRFTWYRTQSDRGAAVCSIHPSEPATLQCLECSKRIFLVSKSYHCSTECFEDGWSYHRRMHWLFRESAAERHAPFGHRGVSGPPIPGPNWSGVNGPGNLDSFSSSVCISQQNSWVEVGQGKTYTPTAYDIGHVLKLECTAISASTWMPVGYVSTVITSEVIPAPSPTPRRMVPVSPVDGMVCMVAEERISASGTFTILSYNVLADLRATAQIFSYCPPWALLWGYRRQNLLREILGYRADIICLQEVQSNHYDEFFEPELEKNGYDAVYMRKTPEISTMSYFTMDGCATFYRSDLFKPFEKYNLEFNEAAQLLANGLHPAKRNVAISRWCKVHTLLKGLEKILAKTDIPMLVVGDFNSVPGSAPHKLLATGRVDPQHPDLSSDMFGMLCPSRLFHQLRLVSAYSSFAYLTGTGPDVEKQRNSIDSNNEPLFTNLKRDFRGTLDYIFYTEDSLGVEALLELLDEDILTIDRALPSPKWSSDHIALLAEFRFRRAHP